MAIVIDHPLQILFYRSIIHKNDVYLHEAVGSLRKGRRGASTLNVLTSLALKKNQPPPQPPRVKTEMEEKKTKKS